MDHKFLYALVVLVAMFWLASCKKATLKTLDKNQVALFHCSDDSSLQRGYICFDSLLQDSRCPKGGECVWQGTALIQVTFHDGNQPTAFTMSLRGYPGLGHVSDTTINGFKISFTALDPYPDLNYVPKPGDIKASLSITR